MYVNMDLVIFVNKTAFKMYCNVLDVLRLSLNILQYTENGRIKLPIILTKNVKYLSNFVVYYYYTSHFMSRYMCPVPYDI